MSQDIRKFFMCSPSVKSSSKSTEIKEKKGKKRLIIDSDSEDDTLVSPKNKRTKNTKVSPKKNQSKNGKKKNFSEATSKYFEVNKESVATLFGRSPVKRVLQPAQKEKENDKSVDLFADEDEFNSSVLMFDDEEIARSQKVSSVSSQETISSQTKTINSPVKSECSSRSIENSSPQSKSNYTESPIKNKEFKCETVSPVTEKSPNKNNFIKEKTKSNLIIETKIPAVTIITPKKKKKVKPEVVMSPSNTVPVERPVSQLWVDKYKPSTIKQIIGQQGAKSNVNKLLRWLQDWHLNHSGTNKLTRPSPWAKDDNGAYFKAALLSGPPGVGKTTSAHLVCKEMEMDVVEFNASDTRSKKLLNQEIGELLSSKSLSPFFQSSGEVTKRHVLIMDEVDGMAGNEDRGGVQELMQLIKNSKVPVICMCNDRNHPKIRSLANYCFDLRFSRPRAEQIKGAMMSVCFKEKIKVKPEDLMTIITNTNQDVRLILNHLSLLAASTSQQMKATTKDVKIGPWDVIKKVFNEQDHKTMTIHDKSDLFFNDYSIIPLFVQENYLSVIPHSETAKSRIGKMKLFYKAAESIACGELTEHAIRSKGAWSLLPTQAMFSSVIPGDILEGHLGGQINFPLWLGKNSRRGKIDRLTQEVQAHTRLKLSGSKEDVVLDYGKSLRDAIVGPLRLGSEGVSESLTVMKEYGLLREDLDSLSEITSWQGSNLQDPFSKIDSKVKAAFTRAYNKDPVISPFSSVPTIKKKNKRDFDEVWGSEGGEEDEVEEEENDDDDLPNPLIVVKKGADKKSKAGTSSSKTKGGSTARKRAKKN